MSCVSWATPGTEACDAVGRALRPKWREWLARHAAGPVGAHFPKHSIICVIEICDQTIWREIDHQVLTAVIDRELVIDDAVHHSSVAFDAASGNVLRCV